MTDVPRGELPTVLAKLFAAELELNVAAGPWLAGVLPVPVAQLRDLSEKGRIVRELCAEMDGELRAVYRLVQAQRERAGEPHDGAVLGRWDNVA